MSKYLKYGVATLIFVLVLAFPFLLSAQRRKSALDFSALNENEVSHQYLAAITEAFGPLSPVQINAVNDIVQAFVEFGDRDGRKLVYILATAWHESKLKPIEEIRAKKGTRLRALQDRYWDSGYYGRGYVQLTWEINYARMSEVIGYDLVNHPDLVLNSNIAAEILVYGMLEGLFTGKKLADYFNEVREDYYHARRIVNGTGRATLIKTYAQYILDQLDLNTALWGSV